MRKINLLIIVVAALVVLAGPGLSQAGTEVTLSVPVVDGLKFSLGLRIDTRSISLDGILFLEDDAGQKKQFEQTGKQTKRTVHRMQFGDYPNFFTTAHKCYMAARAVQKTATRMAEHWIAKKISKSNQPKGSEDADSR